MQIKNPAYFGKILHKKGFRVWAIYMFRLIEGRDFIEEPLHNGLFQEFQDIYDGKTHRSCINVPPRSGKTSLAKYFIAYAYAGNPDCNFIYTSFSQSLLNDISRSLADIMRHPVYREMYEGDFREENLEVEAIDDFWKSYLEENEGKATFSTKKITTRSGGTTLFASIGSAITGFGAGIRGAKRFSGCLFIDDANKPADIRSQTMRNKVKTYYTETLISRLNDSFVPICNIQQRLHLEDLSGFLEKVYNFKILKRPLIEGGQCQLPSQYSPERIAELQKNEFMFSAQYQQAPTQEGGNLFKLETYRKIPRESLPTDFDYRFITADLAFKEKETNDFNVFSYWGVKSQQVGERLRPHLYLIDVKKRRMNAVDVEDWVDDWIKEKLTYGFRYVWIEDKGHGIYLNQLYRKKKGYPVPSEETLKETLPRDRDKIMRANNVIPCLDSVIPNLIFNQDIEGFSAPKDQTESMGLEEEFLAFPNVDHDDFTDTVIDAIKIGLFTEDVVAQWDQLLGRNG